MNQPFNPAFKLRFGITLASLILLGLGTLYFHYPKPTASEPTFEGKTLTYWVEKLHYDDMFVDAVTHEKLPAFRKDQEAIRAIGTNAVPYLLDILQLRDNAISALVSRGSEKVGERLRVKSVEARHEEAICAFKALGEKGAAAVPVLTEMLREGDVTRARISMSALSGIGPAAHPSIRHATNYIFHPQLWSDVTQLISCVGTEATDALPALEAALKSTNVNWHVNALSALSRLGTNTAPLIPIILPFLKDQNSGVAGNALNVVSAARLTSPEVKEALLGALQNSAYSGNPRFVHMALTNLFPEFRDNPNFILPR